MKVIYIVWLLCATVGALPLPTNSLPYSTAQVAAHSRPGDSVSNVLVATATVLSQSYCHVDRTSFSVLIDIQLHLTNASDRPVILSRKIDTPDILQVAKSVKAGEAKQFEYAPNFDKFVSENPRNPPLGEAPDSEHFIVLGPGQSYDVKTSTTVVGTKESTSQRGLVNPGAHVLRLGISTWPYYGYDDVESLRRKWARFGDLQYGLVYTDFVSFRIPEKFKNPRCSIP